MSKKKNIIEGHFTSVWEDGTILQTTATLNLDTYTYEVKVKIASDGPDRGCLLSEEFESLDGTIYPICPQCHNAMKVVMVPDNVGNGLHEELECPLCEHFS
jgi:hypothetical protein